MALVRGAWPAHPQRRGHMPDQTVKVSYTPTTSPEWVFDKNKTTMTAAGKIIFHRVNVGPNWKFVCIEGLPPEWTWRLIGGGNSLEVDDPDRPIGSFTYWITIEL